MKHNDFTHIHCPILDRGFITSEYRIFDAVFLISVITRLYWGLFLYLFSLWFGWLCQTTMDRVVYCC
jgi:hypothetical protein